ncbi:ectoine hydroxylase-related dioxygenase (phytanoyl-CoA dioxygenase family) [Paenibacillus taihuensis]|uniref:Ectoine hydroxylase-related dioxygenase (Phytanoyl-CoA dioxygenase family) n=1 Tax=Paenibacillus taihuensis TaxID=1156355 RepID=A0A3D9R0V1_9BACL|nr:phytanoyl-CoA dioxygenase family protein [Paenibacillus taihuensis]REE67680.1 ectoine hydroxylase-related dioxygenase (phytanoyl-CoA dioxygenase family) [Paenibacillus taihuensis]
MSLHGLTEEQQLMWERDGFLVIDNFLSEDEVNFYNDRIDEAFVDFETNNRVNPATGQLNHVKQICGIIEYGEPFLQLLEHQRMMNIMRDLIGNSFVMIDNDALLKPPGKVSHTNWHRDTSTKLFVGEKQVPWMIKVFYFLSDVPYDGGCLAFLPGSTHMKDADLPKVEKQEDLPGHVRMNVKKGTAVIFNGYTYHSALNNLSDVTRRSLIYNYAQSALRTWPGYEPSERIKSEATSNMRKMLLGVTPWMVDAKAFEDVDGVAAGKMMMG